MSQESAQVESISDATDATPQVQLQIGDIEACIRLIDYCADQGAYKTWQTIQEVMVLRNRLTAFMHSVAAPVDTSTAAASAETPAEAADVPESPAASQ